MNAAKINRISALLLAAGFAAAIAIYFTAAPEAANPFGDPWASKRFIHEMRVIGGAANTAAAEFVDWFASLWHGRNLAGTVAVLTVLVTLGFRFVAARPDLYRDPPPPEKRSGP